VGTDISERNRGSLARYTATRAVGMAALGGLAALGLGAFDADPATASEGATTSTTPAVTTSADFTVDLQIEMPNEYAITLRSHGQADFAHHSVTLWMEVPMAGLHPNDIDPRAPGADGPLSFQGEWVGGKAYVKIPSSLRALDGGAQDLSYDPTGAEADNIDATISRTAVAITYAQLLLATLAGHGTEHHMGTRSIGGKSARGTELDLTLAQLLKVIPGLSPAMDQDITKMPHADIPVTIWIDRQGRLVEVTMTQPSALSQGSITGTVRFSDYDAPVSILAPAPDLVRPLSKGELALFRAEDPFAPTH
jgi:hypothetical protein